MPVQVRDATAGDADALARLWPELVPPVGGDGVADLPGEIVARALANRAAEAGRILVAELDGTVVGCAFLRIALVSPLDPAQAVQLSHVQVARGVGRQGVGTALIEETVTWAEQQGIDSVVAAVPAGDREANRFLARRGMVPVAALRAGTVAAIRARLPHPASVTVRQNGRSGRNVGQVVAARRSQRRARTRQAAS
jgi:N-acetylglutamate synthase-like GNAT family acetyltransferase